MMGFLTSSEAAERLGVNDSRIRQLIASGKIKRAEKIGTIWLIPENEIKALAGVDRGPGRPMKPPEPYKDFQIGPWNKKKGTYHISITRQDGSKFSREVAVEDWRSAFDAQQVAKRKFYELWRKDCKARAKAIE